MGKLQQESTEQRRFLERNGEVRVGNGFSYRSVLQLMALKITPSFANPDRTLLSWGTMVLGLGLGLGSPVI